jgi:hypothetical protein
MIVVVLCITMAKKEHKREVYLKSPFLMETMVIDVICLLELFNQLMYFARGFKVYVEFFISLNPLSRGRR